MAEQQYTLTSYDPVYVTAKEVEIPETVVREQALRWLAANKCKNGEEPKLTDQFVNSHVEELNSVDDLLIFIRFNLYKDNREVQKLSDQDAICRELAKRLAEELPESLIQESIYASRLRFEDAIRRSGKLLPDYCKERGITAEELDAELAEKAIQSLKEDSALAAYAQYRNYTLEPEDFYNVIPGDSIEEKAHKRRQIEMDGRLAGMEQYALKVKALNEIMDNAMIRRSDDVEYVRYGDVSKNVMDAYNENPEYFISM